jgi:predicted phosphodiesterase
MPQLDLRNNFFAVYTDIHADEASFKEVLRLTPDSVKHRISLGDIVGYGNQPRECIALEQRCDLALRGNHDEAMVNPEFLEEFGSHAEERLIETKPLLTQEDLAYLSKKPIFYASHGLVFSHASLQHPLVGYVSHDKHAAEMFDSAPFNLAFVGHSHIPALFEKDASGKVLVHDVSVDLAIDRFDLKPESRYIAVVPSVTPGRGGYKDPGFVTYNPKDRILHFLFARNGH